MCRVTALRLLFCREYSKVLVEIVLLDSRAADEGPPNPMSQSRPNSAARLKLVWHAGVLQFKCFSLNARRLSGTTSAYNS